MDPFRNGTDKKRFRTHIFVFFSTCKRSPFFRYRSVTFLRAHGAPRQLFSVRHMRIRRRNWKVFFDTRKLAAPFDCEVRYKGR